MGQVEAQVTVGSSEKYSVRANLLRSSVPVNKLLLACHMSLSSTNSAVLVRGL